MSLRANGSYIGPRPDGPTTSVASGIWDLRTAERQKRAAAWPVAPAITITSQPGNQTASSGSAAFSVSATVTQNATLSYQWQKQESGSGSFTNVGGATSSTLALSGLTHADDDGDVYRVVVSATGGAESVTSSSATLTVSPGDPLWGDVLLLVPFDNTPNDIGPDSRLPSYTNLGYSNISYAAGKFGNAATLSSNTQLTYGVTAPASTDFTLEFWVKKFNGGVGNRAVLLGNIGSGLFLELQVTTSGFQVENFDGGYVSTSAATNGQWYHFAFVRQGSTGRWYYNGQQIHSGEFTNIAMSNLVLWQTHSFDDVRLTAACRYPNGTTFTPPTEAFPGA